MWMFDRKQENSVKKLSFKKINLTKILVHLKNFIGEGSAAPLKKTAVASIFRLG